MSNTHEPDRYTPDQVRDFLKQFKISKDRLTKLSDDMCKEFALGLESKGHPRTSIAMLPSFVPALPDGSETGQYVAIDLSGKNLRLLLCTLNGREKKPEIKVHNFMVPSVVMTGTGEHLFNFIVNCLQKFLTEYNLEKANLPMGFVFSFPCELLSIRSARLLWWTKGFNIEDCLQKDVVALLEEALSLNMSTLARVRAVMNDTVGQLATSAYEFGEDCVAAVVIGYGCNSSYLEDVSRIKKCDTKLHGYKSNKMVVVTEWEEFGSKGELVDILTPFDQEVDMASVHRGGQILDKLTGALYLGEIVRRVLAQLVIDHLLFHGSQVESLDRAESFPTKFVAEILRDESEDRNYVSCRRICDELDVPSHGTIDYEIIYEVCKVVSERSAAIVAAAISALIRHIGRPKIKIGLGGALIQFHPTYHNLLLSQLKALAPTNFEWKLVQVTEGSVMGAALVAAVAQKMGLE